MKKLFAALLVAVPLLAPLLSFGGEKLKVVYHVTEFERVPFVLGNIENHIKGVGGPENVDIVLVAHGPALKAFARAGGEPTLLERAGVLQKKGIEFDMCGNTLNREKLTLADLPDGFVRVDQGGVVRIAELQKAGYLYIRP